MVLTLTNALPLIFSQGLLDLHEEAGDLEKVVEACSAVKRISQGSGDTEHYLSCMKKLALTYTKMGRPEQALEAWQEIVHAPEIQTPEIKFEALCGVVDAQAMLLEGGLIHNHRFGG